MPTAIVSGALANKPWNGGNAWTRLSYVLGLQRLGFDVVFVEQLDAPSAEASGYFQTVSERFGLEGALVQDGLVPQELRERVEGAALLINIGGHLTIDPLKRAARVAIFLDDDPGHTQFWHATGALGTRLAGHDYHFTFGANIGLTGCPIPTNGLEWRPTRPPVVLSEWPLVANGDRDRLTTVASWRGGYGRLEVGGHSYGQKAHEFRKLAGLPGQVPQRLEIALDIHPGDAADAELLLGHGWTLADPREVAGDPDSFRSYVQGAGGEVSAAQGLYVGTGSGWFSDRTVRYLASGKPALVQDTGFAPLLPVGEGLIPFRTPGEAAAGARRIDRDYALHAEAARDIAERFFDSDVVLGHLLDEVGLG